MTDLSSVRTGRRSPLYRWMWANREQLCGAAVDWTQLMPIIAELGLKDRTGKAPDLRTAQQTLYRMKKEAGKLTPAPARQPAPIASSTPRTTAFGPAKVEK